MAPDAMSYVRYANVDWLYIRLRVPVSPISWGRKLVGLLELQTAKSRKDLAMLFGWKASALSYLLYYVPDAKRYKKFEIPKKDGGSRKITAPIGAQKAIQKKLATLLYTCCSDIDTQHSRRCVSHGFRRGRSIITNAREHRNQRYVLNIDIENFFPSFNFGRVRGFFIKSNDFKLHPDVATAIAQIACFENGLPQGSPCSPVIADLISGALDARLVRLAKSLSCTYTRYADDITFSTNRKNFPSKLAYQDMSPSSKWELGAKLTNEVTGSGFKINTAKTRMQCRHARQLVTGLTVNMKVNIRADYYRYARAMCQQLFASGKYFLPAQNSGKAVAGPILDIGADESKSLDRLTTLEGILSHIHHVRNSADNRDEAEKKKSPTATRLLYRKFLFYKYFVNSAKPVLLCEGKTDSIYLKAAIAALPHHKAKFTLPEGSLV